MEQEHDTPNLDYIKGFNEGYMLAKHLPELSEQLSRADIAGTRGNGLQAGRQQVTLEQERHRQPKWMHPGFKEPKPDAPAADRQRDFDRDIDR